MPAQDHTTHWFPSPRSSFTADSPTTASIHLGNRLRDILSEFALSGQDLATLTRIPYATILRMLRQKGNFLLEDVRSVSLELGVPIEEIFFLTDPAADVQTSDPAHDALRPEAPSD